MKTDAWGCKIWEPTAEPYRVLPEYRSNQSGCFGWVNGKAETFATEAEARAYAATIKGARKVYIHVAINPETWPRNSRWKRLETLSR